MRRQTCFGLLGLSVAGIAMTGCGKTGAHTLVLQLSVALDSTSLVIRNPSGMTYYRTEVNVNDAFRWHVGTLAPGIRRIVRLDRLRDGAGQRFNYRTPVADLWCYAQDSAGNFGGFTWLPAAQKP